ncbi:collagen alpha-5(IV) chain-like [Myiozetetes cayanensis]|uniref:collagen alpha-5(IV) chain-like n=1 Tax=Myiozetetes cayanensis TaxID=478635 RepID=UPI00216068A0|nr:collagen alpha-5(IV) chain-like [Myiozetetes cayanensis]
MYPRDPRECRGKQGMDVPSGSSGMPREAGRGCALGILGNAAGSRGWMCPRDPRECRGKQSGCALGILGNAVPAERARSPEGRAQTPALAGILGGFNPFFRWAERGVLGIGQEEPGGDLWDPLLILREEFWGTIRDITPRDPHFTLPKAPGTELFPSGRNSGGQSQSFLGIPTSILAVGWDCSPQGGILGDSLGHHPPGSPFSPSPSPWGMELFPSGRNSGGQSGTSPLGIPFFSLPKPLGMELFPSGRYFGDKSGHYNTSAPFSSTPLPPSLPSTGMIPEFPQRIPGGANPPPAPHEGSKTSLLFHLKTGFFTPKPRGGDTNTQGGTSRGTRSQTGSSSQPRTGLSMEMIPVCRAGIPSCSEGIVPTPHTGKDSQVLGAPGEIKDGTEKGFPGSRHRLGSFPAGAGEGDPIPGISGTPGILGTPGIPPSGMGEDDPGPLGSWEHLGSFLRGWERMIPVVVAGWSTVWSVQWPGQDAVAGSINTLAK